jgi:hypothetical protein
MKSVFAGKIQVSTSSAAKIYLDIQIPEVQKFHARSYPMNCVIQLSTSTLHTNKKYLFPTALKETLPSSNNNNNNNNQAF